MNTVEPIRNKSDLDKIKTILKNRSKRDFLLFLLGINTGLRISDILALKVNDVVDKNFISLVEKKTKKHRKIMISDNLKKQLIFMCVQNKRTTTFLKAEKEKTILSQEFKHIELYNQLANPLV